MSGRRGARTELALPMGKAQRIAARFHAATRTGKKKVTGNLAPSRRSRYRTAHGFRETGALTHNNSLLCRIATLPAIWQLGIVTGLIMIYFGVCSKACITPSGSCAMTVK
jgi:hypothetical protein